MKYSCPRCGNDMIKDYGDTFGCPGCNLEFEKRVYERLKDKSNALSIDEIDRIKMIINEI